MTNSEAIKIIGSYAVKNAIVPDCHFPAFEIAINCIKENDKLKAEIEQYKSALTTWNNANNEMLKFNQELKDKIEQLEAELERSVKLPERRSERKIEEHEFGILGKGFDIGWNSCLDRIDILKGKVEE